LLTAEGADEVVQPEFEAGLEFVRQVLAWQGVAPESAERLIDTRRETVYGVRSPLTMQEPILCLSLPRSTGDRAYQRWRFHNQSILVCVIAILRAVLRTRLAALASVLVTRQWADQLGNAIEGKTRTRPLWAGHVREGEGDMGSRRVLGEGFSALCPYLRRAARFGFIWIPARRM
jgi:hypothetical protein